MVRLLELQVVLRFFALLWRFGAVFDGETEYLRACWFLFGLFLVMWIPTLAFTIFFRYCGRAPRICCAYTAVTQDFFLHILAMWSASQLANLVPFIAREKAYAEIALLLVISAFGLTNLLFGMAVSVQTVAYSAHSTISWIGGDLVGVYAAMHTLAFATRTVEIVELRWVRFTMAGVAIVTGVLVMAWWFVASPGATREQDTTIMMFMAANEILFVVKALFLFGVQVDSHYVAVLYPVIVTISYMLARDYYARRETRLCAMLSEVMEEDPYVDGFERWFTGPCVFLNATRVGFRNGHPLVLSWTPFLWAIEKWPDNEVVWMQFMRFLAIYQEDTALLTNIYQRFRATNAKSMMKSAFLLYLKRTLNNRSKQMSKEFRGDM